jgi:hypothetical protein
MGIEVYVKEEREQNRCLRWGDIISDKSCHRPATEPSFGHQLEVYNGPTTDLRSTMTTMQLMSTLTIGAHNLLWLLIKAP